MPTKEQFLRQKIGNFVAFVSVVEPALEKHVEVMRHMDMGQLLSFLEIYVVPHKTGIYAREKKALDELFEDFEEAPDVANMKEEHIERFFRYLECFLEVTDLA